MHLSVRDMTTCRLGITTLLPTVRDMHLSVRDMHLSVRDMHLSVRDMHPCRLGTIGL